MARLCTYEGCRTPAEWHTTVLAVDDRCDLHRATVDATRARHNAPPFVWSRLRDDLGQLVAIAVVVAAALLLPGCDRRDVGASGYWLAGVVVALMVGICVGARLSGRSRGSGVDPEMPDAGAGL